VTQFTAGLAVGVPRPPELVYPPSFPFRKDFWVFNCIWHSTLVFDVFTSYEDYSGPLANVLINGVNVGKIAPRGWAQTGGELAPLAFQFGNGMINTVQPGGFGRTGWNILEVVPGTSYDYLVVGNWRFHYQQALPP
jgi:hypothetical protein